MTLAFLSYGMATGSGLAVPYAVIVLGGALLVAALEPDDGYTRLALTGLCLWALGHLAGGIIGIGDGRTLYNSLLPGQIHFDNVVHFVGFGTSGLLWWEATRPWLPVPKGHEIGAGVAVWLAGMGVGALNELIEYVLTLVLEETNVGGFHNTGRDLIANCLGAGVAGAVVVRRLRRTAPASAPEAAGSARG